MSAPIGNWQRELENALHLSISDNTFEHFKACTTDKERFSFFKHHNFLNGIDWINSYFEHCHKLHGKKAEHTSQLRLEGNKCFQKKLYSTAASKYSQATVNAPSDSEELALAYGNRSAALHHLKLFKDCLTDIGQAIQTGFPNKLLHKLYMRRCHCLYSLGQSDQTEKFLIETEAWLQQSDLDDKKRRELQREISDLRKINNQKALTLHVEQDEEAVLVSHGNNDVLVQASAAVTLQHNEQQGRFLTACKDITPGDTLIVERPFAAVLLPDHYSTHCHHCFGKLNVSYPCRQCTQVLFCCPECAGTSWVQYHHIECHYLQLLHSVGIAHLSLRVVLVAGLPFLYDFREKPGCTKINNRLLGMDENGQYCRNYQSVFDLMTHTDDMEAEDLFQYIFTAQLLLKILQHSKWLGTDGSKGTTTHGGSQEISVEKLTITEEEKLNCKSDTFIPGCTNKSDLETQTSMCIGITHSNVTCPRHALSGGLDAVVRESSEDGERQKPAADNIHGKAVLDGCLGDDELYIWSLLLRHIQQLVCNAHAITDLQCSQEFNGSVVEDKSQVRVATAIYPTASLMNHSCDPNIISSFSKDTLVVKATKPVPIGGEIFNCYGPHHKRMSYQERQRCLEQQYFFRCHCSACSQQGESEALMYGYKCWDKKCSGPVIPTHSQVYVCQLCKVAKKSVQLDKAKQADTLFQKGLQYLHQQNMQDAIATLSDCHKIRMSCLYKHNKHLSEVQDCLARCLAMIEKFDAASDLLEKSSETVGIIYGENSIEFANELQKLSEVLIHTQHSWDKALQVTEQALMLFLQHYGKSHDTVKELTSAAEQLRELIQRNG